VADIQRYYLCVCVWDYRREFELSNGFIDHLYTRLGTTNHYSATSNLQNSQHPLSHFPVFSVFSRFLTTVSNSGDFSASRAQVLPSRTLVQNCQPAVPSTELGRHLFSGSVAVLSFTNRSTLSLDYLRLPILN
jgi:hypothetical protein